MDVSPRGCLNWPATCLAFVVWRLPGIRLAARNGKHDLQDTTTFQDEPQYNARWAASDLLTAHVVSQTSLLPGACSDTHSGAPSLNIHSNSRPSGCGRAGHRPHCPLGRHFGRWCVGRWCVGERLGGCCGAPLRGVYSPYTSWSGILSKPSNTGPAGTHSGLDSRGGGVSSRSVKHRGGGFGGSQD